MALAFWNFPEFFSPKIFDLNSVESAGEEPMDKKTPVWKKNNNNKKKKEDTSMDKEDTNMYLTHLKIYT